METKPRKFNNDEILDYWRDYNDEVRDSGFRRLPTQSNFTRWLSSRGLDCDRKTVYNYLHKYFPDIKKDWDTVLADTLAEGAALGKYNPTASIFCLKNWCGWGDGAQEFNVKQTSEVTASSKLLKALLDDNTKRE